MRKNKPVVLFQNASSRFGRLVRFAPRSQCELLEARTLLSAAPIQFGAVYTEQDLGSDAHADTIEISFVGGADGTQLTRVELDGDKYTPGLSLSDMLFDTLDSGLGVDLAYAGSISKRSGEFDAQIFVEDGSSKLILQLDGFDAGEKLILGIDVDEVQGFEPDETDLALVNDELDPIASGAEFQGSQLTAYFSAPHFHDVDGTAEFRNRYDQNMDPTNLDLPRDDDGGTRDRTAGAVGEVTQTPLPISISGRVYEDMNANLQREPEDVGLADVEVALFVRQDGDYVFTGHTTTTNGVGEYAFGTELDLLPGDFELREVQPDGYFSVGAEVGNVAGVASGSILTSDILTSISIPLGGTNAVEYNFAEARVASLRGRVQLSSPDGDCWDETIGHDPIVGATVLLLDANGETISETTTDDDGRYEFTGLRPGEYSLVELTPADLLEGGAKAGDVRSETRGDVVDGRITSIELLSGDDGVEYEFCDHVPATLAGSVYHDRDNDGVPDVGEEGIAGALLSLLDEEGELVDSVETDSDGRYEFVGLRAGNYRVMELHPRGWLDGKDRSGTANGRATGRAVNPGDEIQAINLLWGDVGVDFDFGELKPGSLEGRVHLSTPDGDCWDVDEGLLEPVAGAVVQLMDANGQVLAESVTDADGNYFFHDLEPGEYGVREITPDGLLEGGANPGLVDGVANGAVTNVGDIVGVTLNSDQHGVEYDFCEHKPAVISGNVFSDADNDGIRENGDEPIANVLIQIFDDSGTLVAETTTDPDGRYEFTGLLPGKYSLRQTQPTGYLDGIDSAGTFAGQQRGRAINPGDSIVEINVGWGEVGEQYNFAEIRPASLSGSVHSSGDEDCWNDPDAEPLQGVRILLRGENGRTVAETVTNEQGEYTFQNLTPGVYTVEEIQPRNVFDGGQHAGTSGGDATSAANQISSVTLAPGVTAARYDFCEEPASTLSGYVFVDGAPIELQDGETLPTDISGIRDGRLTNDDSRLPQVMVELRNGITGIAIDAHDALPGHYADGPIQMLTDVSGYYEFTGLPNGNYAVYQIQPDGYIDGIDTAGSTNGIAINPVEPGEDDVFITQFTATLVVKPLGNDAILRIALPPGVHSQFNNFSEVLTVAAPNVPPVPKFPGPREIPPAIEPQPLDLYRYARDVAPNPLVDNPILHDGSSGAKATTWHLSIIDGGQPRVSMAPEDVSFLFPTAVWQQRRLAASQWEMEGPDGDVKTHYFGLKNSYPVTGDFNGDGATEIGVFVKGHWFIDLNGNGRWDSEDLWAKLGYEGDLPVVGDWDGDGKDDIGIFGRPWPDDSIALRKEHGLPDMENQPDGVAKNMPAPDDDVVRGRRVMKHTARGRLREDVIDHVFLYGTTGDVGVVGDWNGDGIDTVGVFRGGVWHLDVDGNGRWTDPDEASSFGRPGDMPLVGDFNGDGIDDLAIVRNGRIIIDANRNRRIDADDLVVKFDQSKGFPIVGKWLNDGRDHIGTFNSAEREPMTVASLPKTE